MTETHRYDTSEKLLICVDSYDNGVLQGRIFRPGREGERFSSLSQCLLRLDQILNEAGSPQSFATPRIFTPSEPTYHLPLDADCPPRGTLGTFSLRVLFRRNASWQGEILWLERDLRQSFRSVLELIVLLDSALRDKANS